MLKTAVSRLKLLATVRHQYRVRDWFPHVTSQQSHLLPRRRSCHRRLKQSFQSQNPSTATQASFRCKSHKDCISHTQNYPQKCHCYSLNLDLCVVFNDCPFEDNYNAVSDHVAVLRSVRLNDACLVGDPYIPAYCCIAIDDGCMDDGIITCRPQTSGEIENQFQQCCWPSIYLHLQISEASNMKRVSSDFHTVA